MPQIFHPSTNTLSKLSIFGGLFLVAGLVVGLAAIDRSLYSTDVGVARKQPVPFSHKHHVGGMGIDCRYCHASVETSPFAGIPSTNTCLNCHTQIWADSAALAPVRDSFRTGQALFWTRVHNLPDFVYFDHSIHVNKGIGCVTCHGRVDLMPLMWQDRSLKMEWCLECHRRPERYIRPREQVYAMDWSSPIPQEHVGPQLVREYGIRVAQLTDCSVCHR
jgi:hypothetical protein